MMNYKFLLAVWKVFQIDVLFRVAIPSAQNSDFWANIFWNIKKPPTANEDDLAKHFAKFGLVDHVSVAKDKNGGDGHKGFAFITFQDKQVNTIPPKWISPQISFTPNKIYLEWNSPKIKVTLIQINSYWYLPFS